MSRVRSPSLGRGVDAGRPGCGSRRSEAGGEVDSLGQGSWCFALTEVKTMSRSEFLGKSVNETWPHPWSSATSA